MFSQRVAICAALALALRPAFEAVQLDDHSLVRREAKKNVDVDSMGHFKSAPSATASDSYFTTDGCPKTSSAGSCPHRMTVLQHVATKAAVVCCEKAGNRTGFAVKLQEPKQCYGGNIHNHQEPVSFQQANNICGNMGKRLCSFAEVHKNQACGAGCTTGCHLVWTSTAGPCSLTTDSWEQGARCEGDEE